ncbi:DUF4232 domain-containing protein [Dactylosporangium sp. NPDC051485]|uniref:DUF4232 domain-containing protein n=1 Tax=Dactylosporangium sp. NPDC051485 TaxID=3154846 RepID=UPI00343B9EDC
MTRFIVLGLILVGVAACAEAGTSNAGASPVTSGSASDPASAAAAGQSSQSGRCHTGELEVTAQAAPGGGAAGSVYTWLVFTNASGRACTLYGYPGVSWVTGADGQQVNQPAERDPSGKPATVTLRPGGAAHAQVRAGHPDMFPDICEPVPVAGYRVYPPDETSALFVPAAGRQCSADGVNRAVVEPIATAGS